MRDLETAGRAVVEGPPLPPTPVELIEQRGRRRRRRGLQLRVGIALTCVVGLVGGAVAFAIDRHATTKPAVTVQPPADSAITDAQMRAHLGADAPAGWVPVDYGDVRIFVPPSWSITTSGCASEPSSGWIELGGSFQGRCIGPADPKAFVQISGTQSAHEPGPARIVHGYRLYPVGAPAPGTYAVPELETTIHVEGAGSERVLATLAPSSKLVALTYRAPVPSDWKRVAYAGVSLRVPKAWPSGSANPCDSPPTDGFAFGNVAGLWGCPVNASKLSASGPSHDGVWIAGASPSSGSARNRASVSNGDARMLVLRGNDDRLLVTSVVRDEAYAVPVTIGLGRDGRVAAAIFDSIRLEPPTSKASSDSTTVATDTTTTTVSTDTTTTTAPTTPTTTGNAPAFVAATSASISGTWRPESITGYGGPLTAPPLNSPPNLEFTTSSEWIGSDGCNGMNGTYELLDDGTFHGKLGIMTAMYCLAGTVPTQTVIASAASAGIAGDELRFFDASGGVLATYARVDTNASSAALVGTWRPDSITGYSGSLTNPQTLAAPLVSFTTATAFTASDGCNDDEGSYRLDYDGSFHLGQGGQTQKACVYAKGSVPPGTTMPVIPNATVLAHAARVVVHGDSLGFLDANGAVLATYSRVPGAPSG